MGTFQKLKENIAATVDQYDLGRTETGTAGNVCVGVPQRKRAMAATTFAGPLWTRR